jgi:Holliday junction resolvase RusA-like endonuclease
MRTELIGNDASRNETNRIGKTMTIAFVVMGEPVPQGSLKSFRLKTGQIVTTHSNRNLMGWRQRIATEAQKLDAPMTSKATLIRMRFVMPRPKSLKKSEVHHTKRPDLDKLIRAVLDGITGILVRDDSQLVDIRATKEYAQPNEQHGVLIELEELP